MQVVGTVAFDTLARVKALPAPEETAGVLELHADLPGGTGANVAMAFARLGGRPRLVSSVGPDFAGSPVESALRRAGIDLSGLSTVDAPTSRAFVAFDAAGRQVTFFHPGASRSFPGAALRPGRAHFCAGEISRYPDLMRQADWVSFDPGQEVFHRDLAQIVACFADVDLLFLNRHERDRLEREGHDIASILAAGPEAVVESRGAEGTLVHTTGGRYAAPAAPASVVDPTGAGDAHRAGFLFAIEQGADFGHAARFANVVGSFVVETIGAQAGQPTLAEALARHEKVWGERPF
ncbi:MAG: nucleoside kinase [Thermoplasmata archaeon]|nr:nucleoside kinase [Thermoplasmata archaeon]